MMDENEADRLRHWKRLRKTLGDRTCLPSRHPSFVLYFVVAVMLVGGVGLWLELHKYYFPIKGATAPTAEAIRTALITFFPALAGSSCMQIILEESDDRALRATAVCLLTVLSLLALMIAPQTVGICAALSVGTIGSLLALWTWWIANANNLALQDKRTDASVGNRDPKADLSGSLDGFTA